MTLNNSNEQFLDKNPKKHVSCREIIFRRLYTRTQRERKVWTNGTGLKRCGWTVFWIG